MEEGCFEVAKMAIAEPYRGQGMGKQLLRGTIAAARNLMLAVERCHLDVEAMVATMSGYALASLPREPTIK